MLSHGFGVSEVELHALCLGCQTEVILGGHSITVPLCRETKHRSGCVKTLVIEIIPYASKVCSRQGVLFVYKT